MSKKKKVEKTLTEKRLSRWNVADKSLLVGTYLLPVATISTYAGINWQDWLEQTSGWNLGCGFAGLLLSGILTVFGLTKYDEIIGKKISKLYYFGLVLMIIGGSAVFLANIFTSFGWMIFCCGVGIVGGGASSSVQKSLTSKKLSKYKDELKVLGVLDEKYDDKIRLQAEKDAEIIKKRKEKVDLL